MYFLLETMAFLRQEPPCPISIINENDTEVLEILDFDPTTCFVLDENVGQWLQIVLPYIRNKGPFDVSLMGNLKCSPTLRLSVSISGCDSGTCRYSRCIASDLVTPGGMGGCKYRCHSTSVCSHITVDIAGLYGTTFTGTLCEIIF